MKIAVSAHGLGAAEATSGQFGGQRVYNAPPDESGALGGLMPADPDVVLAKMAFL